MRAEAVRVVMLVHRSPVDGRLHGTEASRPLSEVDTCSQERKTVGSPLFHVRGEFGA